MIGLKLERVLAAGKLLRSQNTTSPPKDIADHRPQPGLRFQYTVKDSVYARQNIEKTLQGNIETQTNTNTNT